MPIFNIANSLPDGDGNYFAYHKVEPTTKNTFWFKGNIFDSDHQVLVTPVNVEIAAGIDVKATTLTIVGSNWVLMNPEGSAGILIGEGNTHHPENLCNPKGKPFLKQRKSDV